MSKTNEALLEVRCTWVNDNAFYWKAELYIIEKHRKLFRTTTKKVKIADYKYSSISHVFSEAEKLSWYYKVFNLILDKNNL